MTEVTAPSEWPQRAAFAAAIARGIASHGHGAEGLGELAGIDPARSSVAAVGLPVAGLRGRPANPRNPAMDESAVEGQRKVCTA